MTRIKRETIDFSSIPENLRGDFTKTVCALRQVGFDIGIGPQYKEGSVEATAIGLARELDSHYMRGFNVSQGAQYGAHSIEIPPLVLNYGYFPKTYQQEKWFYIQDDLLDFVLKADGQILDKILNRKNRTISGDIEEMILYHSKNRKKLSDLSGVELNE